MLTYKSRHSSSVLEIDTQDDIFERLLFLFEINGGSFQCYDEMEFKPFIENQKTAGFMTYKIIGEKLGVSMERVRQIEQKALRKLKHPSRSAKLREFL